MFPFSSTPVGAYSPSSKTDPLPETHKFEECISVAVGVGVTETVGVAITVLVTVTETVGVHGAPLDWFMTSPL